ncbi:hypothetical protein FUA23_14905 [Neolewinella aurantiaca]|uniref:Uncharacterized protein n=1 Tax=Neolewinella aurantiaca TaxID=2602767 RepID=A0A5C7FBZ3_9BACT|nr:hypothetical protein [Neolewinella aurantiaca]TXF88423.1 hypothetical protein FUA23_14905 [Neolewinella aurantiaca]
MDILKTATNWAKDEVFSTQFFILFGALFVAAGIGFWQLGKTDMARAYIIPALVAGALLMTIGLGLFFTNKARVHQFESAWKADPSAFVDSEIKRVEGTLKEYQNVVFTAIPLIIAACAFVIMFVDKPGWRASMITTIGMLIVILLIDGMAYARIDNYNKELLQAEQEL